MTLCPANFYCIPSDLEASVEELRTDVLSRQCRVNSVDVEGMALLLSNVTKSLAELKGILLRLV